MAVRTYWTASGSFATDANSQTKLRFVAGQAEYLNLNFCSWPDGGGCGRGLGSPPDVSRLGGGGVVQKLPPVGEWTGCQDIFLVRSAGTFKIASYEKRILLMVLRHHVGLAFLFWKYFTMTNPRR